MKRRRIILYILLGLLLIWIISIQLGCMAMRTPDKEWSAKLREKGQTAPPQFLDVPSRSGRTVHAVTLNAADSLPLVVLVHGSPGSADAYLDYLADTVLNRQARLVAMDRAGFGYTDFGHPEINLAAQAIDVQSIMSQLAPGKKVILVGHSLGGPLIVRVAMDYPDQVAGLVIVAGSVDPMMEPHPWWEPVVDAPPVCWLIPKSLWSSNHEIRYLGDELTKMLPLWTGIHCPVRIIHAEDDQLVPVSNAAFAKQKLSGSTDVQLTLLPTGNHFILWSRQELVKQAIVDLLKKI